MLLHLAREEAAHEIADSPEDEGDESLGGPAGTLARLIIDIELPRDEEEIVARSMQKDRREDQRRGPLARPHAAREREVTRHPASDAEEDRFLVTEALQEKGQQQEKDDVRDLRVRGLHEHVLPLQLGEVLAEIHEIEVERDADEEHAEDEDGERRLLHQGERIQPEDLGELHIRPRLCGRRVRKDQ